eukprot:9634909-Prorocentrum_lima.AAC.1
METIASTDDLLEKTMINELSESALRNPHNIEDVEHVASFVRIMLGVVRLSTGEEVSKGFQRLSLIHISEPTRLDVI